MSENQPEPRKSFKYQVFPSAGKCSPCKKQPDNEGPAAKGGRIKQGDSSHDKRNPL